MPKVSYCQTFTTCSIDSKNIILVAFHLKVSENSKSSLSLITFLNITATSLNDNFLHKYLLPVCINIFKQSLFYFSILLNLLN